MGTPLEGDGRRGIGGVEPLPRNPGREGRRPALCTEAEKQDGS